MRYVAIAKEAGVFDGSSACEKSAVSVKRPAAGARTEWVELNGTGPDARLLLSDRGRRACLHTKNTTLWLPHCVLGDGSGMSPSVIVLQDRAAAERRVFRRWEKDGNGVKTPSELLDGISIGALYKFVGRDEERSLRPTQPRRVLHMAQPGSRPGVGFAGVLNPQRIVFDASDAPADSSTEETLWEQFVYAREHQDIVDLHVDIPEADYARLKIYLLLASRWRRTEPTPPIPYLLYGNGTPDYARAFFVLDSLERAFRIESFASKGPVDVTWTGESELKEASLRDNCLIRDSLDISKGGEAVARPDGPGRRTLRGWGAR